MGKLISIEHLQNVLRLCNTSTLQRMAESFNWCLKLLQLQPPGVLNQMSQTICSILLCLHTNQKRGAWPPRPLRTDMALCGLGGSLEMSELTSPRHSRHEFLRAQVLKIWGPVFYSKYDIQWQYPLLAPFQAFWKISKWKTPTSLITENTGSPLNVIYSRALTQPDLV